MDRYRVAPRPVYLSAGGGGGSGGGGGGGRRPLHSFGADGAASGRRSGCAELDIFAAESYFNADDVVKKKSGDSVPAAVPTAAEERPQEMAVDAASQSGRTKACSSEASWNSRSGLLYSRSQSAAAAGKQQSGGGAAANGVAAAAAANGQYCHHPGKKPGSGQNWGLFSRDCPCASRKAVTVDVASEPRSPVTPRIHTRFDSNHVVADVTIFKAKAPPPPPPPPSEEEPVKIKISPGSSTFRPPLANNISAAAPNRGGDAAPFAAFPPDIGRRVVSSGGFTFPVPVGAAKVATTIVDEPPRESLEVFRPIDEESVLADPPADYLAAAGGRGGGGIAAGFARGPGVAAVTADEEAMSDASSDLFDLESFAASSSYPTTYRGRGSRRNSREDDDLPYGAAAIEPALSECMYAPSEVSVVWSVATAEGGAFDAASMANFSSAASACCVEEFSFVPPDAAGGHDGFTAAMSRSAGRKKGGGGGFLNSCRCEKAVSVGPTPVRVVRPPAGPAEVSIKTGGGQAIGLAGGGSARYHPGRVHMPVRT